MLVGIAFRLESKFQDGIDVATQFIPADTACNAFLAYNRGACSMFIFLWVGHSGGIAFAVTCHMPIHTYIAHMSKLLPQH